MVGDPPFPVILDAGQLASITDSIQVLTFGVALCVLLAAVVAVGSFRR